MTMNPKIIAARAAAKEAKLHTYLLAELLGPRQVGSRCRCGYWGINYTVVAIHDDNPMHPSLTVLWDATPSRPAHETEHCTCWDARGGDRIISQSVKALVAKNDAEIAAVYAKHNMFGYSAS